MVNDDFLLQNELGKQLYQELKELPIIDFHNHLSPKEIYKNEPFTNITNLWLDADHYKWRLMRMSGVDENLITGDASELDKFKAYVGALEMAYLNPLYHWSHMELVKYFGITTVLTSENAEEIYNKANDFLAKNEIGPRDLLTQAKVEVLCTTDDLNAELEYHKLISSDNTIDIKVLPTFRPDALLNINSDSFFDVITLLEKNTLTTISGITTFATSLSKRLDYFNVNGCSVADHGISNLVYEVVTRSEASKILKKRLMQYQVTEQESNKFKVYLMKYFIKEYAIRDMVCQLHVGASRDNNDRMFKTLGNNSGYDSVSDTSFVDDLNRLLNEIHSHYPLPKMVLFNANPNDNEAMASLCGNFSCKIPGKIQLGAAWWFNDHYQGIMNQLDVFSSYLNLNTFLGMLTDSRSFLSFVRHDYFRRILANYIGTNVEKGLIPNDKERLVQLVQNISYKNSKKYFNF